MIVYLDASALVKQYVAESGSAKVNALIARAEVLGTAAHFWQASLGEAVTLAAFDRPLWEAGARIGLPVWSPDLPPFLGRAERESHHSVARALRPRHSPRKSHCTPRNKPGSP